MHESAYQVFSNSDSKNHDAFDIAKFILSIAIVAIHTRLGGNWDTTPLQPWLRLAVPLYFMITAYLFFKKYDIADDSGKRKRLKRFALRNGQLYLFWFVVLFVPTLLVRRSWFENSLIEGLKRFILGFLFGSTFPASWYIMASVIAVTTIAIASKRLPAQLIALGAGVGYVFACLACNYGNLPSLDNRPLVEVLGNLPPLSNPYNNFIVGLSWVFLGKLCAQHEQYLNYLYSKRKPIVLILLVIGSILLFIEQQIIRRYDMAYTNDCYLTLPLPAFILFIIIINFEISCSCSVVLRSISTITYCFHATFTAFVVKGAEYICLRDYGIIEFIIVLLTSWLVSWIVLRFEKIPWLSALRYSH